MKTDKKKVETAIIVAMGLNHEIGAGNQLIWHLKDDLKMFKELTQEHPVVMGRKTFEAIKKPLPGRTNIVISRSKEPMEGVLMANSLNEALELASDAPGSELCCIIGGGQIYAAALSMADTLYITKVQAEFPEADTFFPDVNFDQWNETLLSSYPANERNEYAFEVYKYTRLA